MKRTGLFFVFFFGFISVNAQFLANSEIFPGWTGTNSTKSNIKSLVSFNLSIGESYWNYRDKPIKLSGALELDFLEKINIGMGILGENDFWVSAGTKLFASDGLEIESGIQRFSFSSDNQFSNNAYLNSKITISEPFFILVESSYSFNTNNELMRSPWLFSARLGIKINFDNTGFGGF